MRPGFNEARPHLLRDALAWGRGKGRCGNPSVHPCQRGAGLFAQREDWRWARRTCRPGRCGRLDIWNHWLYDDDLGRGPQSRWREVTASLLRSTLASIIRLGRVTCVHAQCLQCSLRPSRLISCQCHLQSPFQFLYILPLITPRYLIPPLSKTKKHHQ